MKYWSRLICRYLRGAQVGTTYNDDCGKGSTAVAPGTRVSEKKNKTEHATGTKHTKRAGLLRNFRCDLQRRVVVELAVLERLHDMLSRFLPQERISGTTRL